MAIVVVVRAPLLLDAWFLEHPAIENTGSREKLEVRC